MTGITELPSGQDEQLARIFRDIRAACGLDPARMAQSLGIDAQMLSVFEQGLIQAMPDWPQTITIVSRYVRLVGIDSGPILRRIEAQRAVVALRGIDRRPPARSPMPAMQDTRGAPAPPGPGVRSPSAQYSPTPPRAAAPAPPRGVEPQARLPAVRSLAATPMPPARLERVAAPGSARGRARTRRPIGRVVALATIPLLGAAALWYVSVNPTIVHAAIARLPQPLPHYAKAGMDLMTVSKATLAQDGLRHIDNADPRSRKADKLPSRRPIDYK